ncbi:MAG TPA: hypothetical protein VFT19_00735, partial [Solirubrobacterales bacterium]|nr:hypothetical protein [Solirubrobacterales bacterium]
MAWARAGIVAAGVGLVAVLASSGGTSVDPPVPRGFPGAVPAFMLGAGVEEVRGVRRPGRLQ